MPQKVFSFVLDEFMFVLLRYRNYMLKIKAIFID